MGYWRMMPFGCDGPLKSLLAYFQPKRCHRLFQGLKLLLKLAERLGRVGKVAGFADLLDPPRGVGGRLGAEVDDGAFEPVCGVGEVGGVGGKGSDYPPSLEQERPNSSNLFSERGRRKKPSWAGDSREKPNNIMHTNIPVFMILAPDRRFGPSIFAIKARQYP